MRPDELNEECIAQLEKAGVRRRRYVAVVGAGPSSPVMPAGAKLREQIAAACGLDADDPRPFWDFFEDAKVKNQDAFCTIINDQFQDRPFLGIEAYEHIVSIPFKSFITLNYDSCLPKAFAADTGGKWEELFSIYPMRRRPDGTAIGLASAVDLGHKRRLVAVHGYRDPNDPFWPISKIVLTRTDYERHYIAPETGSYLGQWWKGVLSLHDCLFIGTSLQEPGLKSVVDYLVKDGNPDFRQRRHLHLKDVSLRRSIQSGGRLVDDYPAQEMSLGFIPQIRFDPKNHFSGLIEILSHFSGKNSQTEFEPGMPALGPIQPFNLLNP